MFTSLISTHLNLTELESGTCQFQLRSDDMRSKCNLIIAAQYHIKLTTGHHRSEWKNDKVILGKLPNFDQPIPLRQKHN